MSTYEYTITTLNHGEVGDTKIAHKQPCYLSFTIIITYSLQMHIVYNRGNTNNTNNTNYIPNTSYHNQLNINNFKLSKMIKK